MPLTPAQHRALHNANTKGGAPRYTRSAPDPRKTIRLTVARRLINRGLLTEINHMFFTTQAGRAELHKPVEHTPLYLRHPNPLANFDEENLPHNEDAQPQGDYTHLRHRAVDDLEYVPPSKAYVDKARITAEQARASFRKDLEDERSRRKAERRPWIQAA